MNVESELKDIINRLYDIQDVSGPDLSKKIYEIILQCREAIGYRKAELDRVQSSRKPIKSADKHFNYDEYLGDIYDSDRSNADNWSREEYNEMVETARDIFYPAVQKAANACRFTVSDNEAEYVAEKCVRCFFDNTSWDEAVNRPEKYYVNSARKPIKSSVDKEILEAAVYDGLMEASPYTQDVAVEWFSNEIDMDDFDSVDDLANYIRNRVEDFADANPGIEQDLIDCGLI